MKKRLIGAMDRSQFSLMDILFTVSISASIKNDNLLDKVGFFSNW